MIIELPVYPGFVDVSILPEASIATSESGFTKDTQVYDWGGKRWLVTVALPAMRADDGRAWEAVLLLINGRAGTFYFHDPLLMTPRGVARGVPTFLSAVAGEVTVEGFTPNVLDQLKAGDWFQVGDRLYRALTAASSDSLGRATFTSWPHVLPRTEVGTKLEIQKPRGEFRLVEPVETKWVVSGLMAPFEFSATSEI